MALTMPVPAPSPPPTAALTTLIVTGAVAVALTVMLILIARRSRRSPDEDAGRSAVGRTVIVPIARPRSATYLVELGAAVANEVGGRLLVLTALVDGREETRTAAELLLQQAEVVAAETGVETSTAVRAGRSPAEAVLHSTVEHDASLVIVGWPSGDGGEGHLGPPVDRIVSDAPAPVLVARFDGHHWQRVLLRLPRGPVRAAELASTRLAVLAAQRVSRANQLPLLRDLEPSDGRVARLVGDIPVDEGGDRNAGLHVDPEVLTVVGVAPDPRRLEAAIDDVAGSGDVVLALAHGPRAADRRPLLTASRALDADAEPGPTGPDEEP